MRVCLFTEELKPPFDEGYKNFAYNLFRQAPAGRKALRLGDGDAAVIDRQIKAGKLLLGGELRKAIREFRPDVLVYIPVSSITPASFARARVLKWHARGAPVAMIGLQPRPLMPVLRLVAPDIVYVQSLSGKQALEEAGFRAGVIRAGVDTERFHPVGRSDKERLREKYALHHDAYIVLHVGHINERRNIRVMADIGGIHGVQAVVVGSSSTSEDAALSSWLEEHGVRMFCGYVERVEELYQLADAYVFSVTESTAAIELPLSVLEAMACNLAVVATEFGGLRDNFSEGDGLYFASDPCELTGKIELARQSGDVNTRAKVEPLTWESVAERFFAEIEQLYVHLLCRN